VLLVGLKTHRPYGALWIRWRPENGKRQPHRMTMKMKTKKTTGNSKLRASRYCPSVLSFS